MAKSKHRKLATKRLQAKTTAKQDISAECIKLVMDRNKQSGIDNWKILQKLIKKDKEGNKPSKKPFRKKSNRAWKKETSKGQNLSVHKDEEKQNEIWFDDVSYEDIRMAEIQTKTNVMQMSQPNDILSQPQQSTIPEESKKTAVIALDCEMVGVGYGGKESALARVSIVNSYGETIYDKYVKPIEKVTDFRTPVSGITPENLQNAPEFTSVQAEVSDIIQGRTLVGHSIKNDLKQLMLGHPKKRLRDTSTFSFFRQLNKGNTPSLRKLAKEILGLDIQIGEHSSVEDARACMQLYNRFKKEWESSLRKKKKPDYRKKIS